MGHLLIGFARKGVVVLDVPITPSPDSAKRQGLQRADIDRSVPDDEWRPGLIPHRLTSSTKTRTGYQRFGDPVGAWSVARRSDIIRHTEWLIRLELRPSGQMFSIFVYIIKPPKPSNAHKCS